MIQRRTGTSRALVHRIVLPFQEFFRAESSSGLLLLACALAALLWANSPWQESYFHLWETKLVLNAGSLRLAHSLAEWINDGLMAVFFFLVGLEIKREILVGELASPRKAALPMAAAIGGMALPAAIFLAFNHGTPQAGGWGIPMATDIAFALGVLALAGDRVPPPLRVFLAALAIVDDLGAVLIIAVFYSAGIDTAALAGAGLVLLLLLALNFLGVRRRAAYLALGVVLWLFFLKSGVHATIAGVLLAATIPARTRINVPEFTERARACLAEFENAGPRPDWARLNERQDAALVGLERATDGVRSPLLQVEHGLVPWVAYGIMPLFALANAGVAFTPDVLHALASPVVLGVALGLMIGKPLGIGALAWLAVRLGLASLPAGVTGRQMTGVGLLSGMGFTMSLFIADLAFPATAALELTKVAVLGASLVVGLAGWLLLWSGPRARPALEGGA
ncbi:MAG TPA: Na+/H+ antiporter NhaA [Longimicrobiales bacterium]|nr:Na+/H+ antiporter NhaA [Longimicrobiales bacterium]